MIEHLLDSLTDALLDTLKILPFLFLTYLIMEWLEHKTGSRTQAAIRRAGKMGPFFGGILGVFPQCGFSAAAANLYAGGLITAGTLTAVFLSTSDEMLPIFISEAVPVGTVIRVLAAKMMIGIVSGFLLDFLYHRLLRREIRYKISIPCAKVSTAGVRREFFPPQYGIRCRSHYLSLLLRRH